MDSDNSYIKNLINFISTWPSLGHRSAARIALYMLNNKDKRMVDFANLVLECAKNTKICKKCGNISESGDECSICLNKNRNHAQICIVGSVSDVWKIEEARCYNGVYYIMQFEDDMFSNHFLLEAKISEFEKHLLSFESIEEVIIANNSDLKSQGFIYYLIDVVESIKKKRQSEKGEKSFSITSLAKGMPVGSSIEYLDEPTILAAIRDRREV